MKIPLLRYLSSQQQQLLIWAVGLFWFYTVVGFLVLPPIVRFGAQKYLSRELHREVAIQKLKLNPYCLSVTIQGLLIRDPDKEPFISWDEVYVNVQIVSLFSKAWVFNEISTSRPYIRVQINEDYSLNFSDLVQKYSTAPSKSSP